VEDKLIVEGIQIFTDGSSPTNRYANTPDSYGGWGVVLKYQDKEKHLWGGDTNTSSNRMELQAVIEALKALQLYNIPVTVYSDSSYVVDGINGWIYSWNAQGWQSKFGGGIINVDLWKQIYDLIMKFDSISVVKVKGHDGNKGNELADLLSKRGALNEAKKNNFKLPSFAGKIEKYFSGEYSRCCTGEG
jgi:ribonuclease HI